MTGQAVYTTPKTSIPFTSILVTKVGSYSGAEGETGGLGVTRKVPPPPTLSLAGLLVAQLAISISTGKATDTETQHLTPGQLRGPDASAQV
jgi:hypothetical protein